MEDRVETLQLIQRHELFLRVLCFAAPWPASRARYPLKNEGVHFTVALYTESTAGRGKVNQRYRTTLTKIRVEMRPGRIRPIHHGQSGQRKSIPDPNRISQTNAANETGQEITKKVLKPANPLVRSCKDRTFLESLLKWDFHDVQHLFSFVRRIKQVRLLGVLIFSRSHTPRSPVQRHFAH